MRLKIYSLTAACTLLATAAVAEDYQFEIGASYVDLDVVDGFGGDIRAHFGIVQPGRGPLAEAAYLTRTGSVGVGYARFDGGDFDLWNIDTEFWADDFYLGAFYSRLDNGGKLETYGVRGGWMVAPNSRLHATWERIDFDFADVDVFTVGGKHVAELGGDAWFNFEADLGVARNGSNDFAYRLRADYYPMRVFGIGARYAGIESDDEWGLGASFFFTPRINGAAEWTRADGDNVWELRLAARF